MTTKKTAAKKPTKKTESFWQWAQRQADEAMAQEMGITVAEAHRRSIAKSAKSWGVSFAEAKRRIERP